MNVEDYALPSNFGRSAATTRKMAVLRTIEALNASPNSDGARNEWDPARRSTAP
jgi:hypothetical protein